MRHWNGLAAAAAALPDLAAWRGWQRVWRQRLLAQDDLTTQLRRFAAVKAGQTLITC